MFRAKPQDGIVWITGASAGIGRAVALRLSGQGYHVAVTARRSADLEALALVAPGRIFAFPCDITDRVGMARTVTAIEATHGPIALALLNAGVYHSEERKGFDVDVVWRTMETNLGGAINGLGPLLEAMLPRGRGQIAMVGSLAGYRGIPGSLAYGASKSALIYIAEALRLTYQPAGLTIQIVNPGFVRTAMTGANDYDMPLMMEVDQAAKRICDGLARGGFEITFPKRLAWAVKAASLLPHVLFFPVMAWATRRAR
jgi:NAD(P)-dependent dehydrogenase (short-subunit alcohol dehydrogenase family)